MGLGAGGLWRRHDYWVSGTIAERTLSPSAPDFKQARPPRWTTIHRAESLWPHKARKAQESLASLEPLAVIQDIRGSVRILQDGSGQWAEDAPLPSYPKSNGGWVLSTYTVPGQGAFAEKFRLSDDLTFRGILAKKCFTEGIFATKVMAAD